MSRNRNDKSGQRRLVDLTSWVDEGNPPLFEADLGALEEFVQTISISEHVRILWVTHTEVGGTEPHAFNVVIERRSSRGWVQEVRWCSWHGNFHRHDAEGQDPTSLGPLYTLHDVTTAYYEAIALASHHPIVAGSST